MISLLLLKEALLIPLLFKGALLINLYPILLHSQALSSVIMFTY